jgi:hypothetical protein
MQLIALSLNLRDGSIVPGHMLNTIPMNNYLIGYVDTIQELAGQTGLTASQQGDLQRAVEQYNSITGDSVEVTDAASGALSKSADEIRNNADAWLENAKAQAYAELNC